MMAKAEAKGVKLLLPVDTVIAADFPNPIDADIAVKTVAADAIPDDMEGLDIGEETRKLFAGAVKSAKTVVWNGRWACLRIRRLHRAPSPWHRLWPIPMP